MNLEEKGLQQRITLLRSHLKEEKALLITERDARQNLLIVHSNHEKQLLASSATTIQMTAFAVRHTQQLTELARYFRAIRKELMARQKQEQLSLDTQIDQDRSGGQ